MDQHLTIYYRLLEVSWNAAQSGGENKSFQLPRESKNPLFCPPDGAALMAHARDLHVLVSVTAIIEKQHDCVNELIVYLSLAWIYLYKIILYLVIFIDTVTTIL